MEGRQTQKGSDPVQLVAEPVTYLEPSFCTPTPTAGEPAGQSQQGTPQAASPMAAQPSPSYIVLVEHPSAGNPETEEEGVREEAIGDKNTLEGYIEALSIFDVKTKAKYVPLIKLIWNEAARGRVYTQNSFCMYFSGIQRLGSTASINLHLREMMMKGIIGLFINGKDYGFENCDDGYLCLAGMPVLLQGVLDGQGNDVFRQVYPTHGYDQSTEQLKEV